MVLEELAAERKAVREEVATKQKVALRLLQIRVYDSSEWPGGAREILVEPESLSSSSRPFKSNNQPQSKLSSLLCLHLTKMEVSYLSILLHIILFR